MKRIFILLIAVMLLPAAGFAQSGKTGDLTWSLSGGTLTIRGNGSMPDYTSDGSPWYDKYDARNFRITSVVIGEGVTNIGESAFDGCINMTSVYIPSSVTSIGRGAFYECRNLISITIPGGVISIEDLAFVGCSSLTSITIPNSMTCIGNYAFVGCSKLVFITIPNSVTSIGDAVFRGCFGLTSVNIPNSVTSIGYAPFESCDGLISIIVAAENPKYMAKNGVLFNKAETELIQYPAGKNGDYVIPGSITSIGKAAFNGSNNLTSVIIPGSVTSIGEEAFGSCFSLTSVDIPGSVTSIGTNAFARCTELTDVTVAWTTLFSIVPIVYDKVFNGLIADSRTLHVPSGTSPLYKATPGWKEFNITEEVYATGNGLHVVGPSAEFRHNTQTNNKLKQVNYEKRIDSISMGRRNAGACM